LCCDAPARVCQATDSPPAPHLQRRLHGGSGQIRLTLEEGAIGADTDRSCNSAGPVKGPCDAQ